MVLQAIQYTPASDSTPPSLKILDQLLLPHRSVFVPIHSCEDAHAAIKQMQVRGAPAIAIVAALALAVEIKCVKGGTQQAQTTEEVRELIGERLEYLKTSRPTAVNLGDAVGKLKKIVERAASETGANGAKVVEWYVAAAEQMLVDDVADNEAIGAHGAKWIQENTPAGQKRSAGGENELKVLTHCNTGSLATGEICRTSGGTLLR
jgi:methylthioribose-1-phosphate isomerase